MLNTTYKMTEEQKAFAEQHHDEVVGGFLAKKQLDYDEYWGVVILKYLYAVRIYLEKPELQIYSFKTIAYRQMYSAVHDYWTYKNRPKRKANVVSLDDFDSYGAGIKEHLIHASTPVMEQIEAVEAWSQVKLSLSEKELDAIQKKADGYSYREIARQSGISYSGICSRFFRARAKARTCLSV